MEEHKDNLNIGKAVFTNAGKLPVKFIIHAVAPVFIDVF